MTGSSTRLEALQKTREIIEIEGAAEAARALIEVCRDAKAPAAAKAAAGSTLLRSAGFFEKREGGPDKELHEMTGVELAAYARQLDRERLALAASLSKAADADENPFD